MLFVRDGVSWTCRPERGQQWTVVVGRKQWLCVLVGPALRVGLARLVHKALPWSNASGWRCAKRGAPHAACIVSAPPLEWYRTYARRIHRLYTVYAYWRTGVEQGQRLAFFRRFAVVVVVVVVVVVIIIIITLAEYSRRVVG